jgi:RNA recognition motif-containing protein
MLTINVRGLPRRLNEHELTELFETHGKVRGLKMAKDLFSGECKGFAEIQMEGHEARNAIAALNGSTLGDSILRVELKTEKHDRRRH